MVKFPHSVFALPFALTATFLAARSAWWAGDAAHPYPTAGQFFLIVVCMVAARSAAMTFNRIVDARIDAQNPRTASRPIPAGIVKQAEAGVFLLSSSAVFLAGCAGFLLIYDNPWPVALSLPVLGYLFLYSYTKRFTQWSHFVLGSAIAFSPLAAWLAIHPASVGWPALMLTGAVTFWIGGFDIIYACQDIEVDREQGLFSLPAGWGPSAALWTARGVHVLTVVLLAALIPVAGLRWVYAGGVLLVAALLAFENALVRPNDFSRVNLAFFTVNGAISLLLGLLAIADCLLWPASS